MKHLHTPKVPIEAPSVKHVLEKTPEPAKTSCHSDTHFCHVYLSKLDISVDLTLPQFYKQYRFYTLRVWIHRLVFFSYWLWTDHIYTLTGIPRVKMEDVQHNFEEPTTSDISRDYPALSGQKLETLPTTSDETLQINLPSAQEIAKEQPLSAETVAKELSSVQNED
ncbi:hypothetical protein C5167_006231 [Papaver somniferum]|uniref:Uncharacterized protein n=1 Tax=Papaver somniferum TaxID=3469 RepID=A0A4Y7JFY2_PAPSO|nr:hypothetical protein C5167_006231 [Papaver somniferum]